MKISAIRLIALREFRDLLRDRRTLLLVLVVPVILYPIFVLVGILFALSILDQKIVVGIAGYQSLPLKKEHIESVLFGSLYQTYCEMKLDDPPLLDGQSFHRRYLGPNNMEVNAIEIRFVKQGAADLLASRAVDVLIEISDDFIATYEQGQRPVVRITGREGDETSKIAVKKISAILDRWKNHLKEVRLARSGLPFDYDDALEIVNPQEAKPITERTADELRDLLIKFFPFLLVMWTMAGGLHPAIDLTAGEKERGTMETLLISPAERSEIVSGKFIAVALFSLGTAWWNVLWMGCGGILLSFFLPVAVLSWSGLIWGVIFAMPLAALFSAIAIGLGVCARSTKEGQYYLLPLFMLVLPLALWAMTPGLKLSFSLSLIPITGLSLLLQNLITPSGAHVPWACWFGVLSSLFLCVLVSLAWASSRFHREDILFREGQTLSLVVWLRRLLRPPQ